MLQGIIDLMRRKVFFGGATLGRKTTKEPEVLEQSMWNRLNPLSAPAQPISIFKFLRKYPGAEEPLFPAWSSKFATDGVGCRRKRCRKQLALSPDGGTYERCRSVLVFCYFRVRGSMEQLLEYGSFLLNPWSLTFPMFVAIVIVKEQRASQIAAHPSNLRVSACKWGYQRILLFTKRLCTQVCPKQGTAQSKGLLSLFSPLS